MAAAPPQKTTLVFNGPLNVCMRSSCSLEKIWDCAWYWSLRGPLIFIIIVVEVKNVFTMFVTVCNSSVRRQYVYNSILCAKIFEKAVQDIVFCTNNALLAVLLNCSNILWMILLFGVLIKFAIFFWNWMLEILC